MKHYDVAIIGAGPGGISAALCLAKSDLKVVLLEKETFPRDKICGDALSGKVLHALKCIDPAYQDLLRQFPPKTDSWGIRFVAPNQEILDIPFKSDLSQLESAPGFISKRIEFDNFLFELLQEQTSVDILQNYRVQALSRSTSSIQISGSGPDLQASLVIGADGAQSRVAKELSDIRMHKMHHSAGIRAYYEGVTGFREHNFIELHFIKDLLPGYFWIFPLPGGWANVGLGMLTQHISKHKVNLKQRLQELLEKEVSLKARFANARLMGKVQGFGLPLGSVKRDISGDRFVLVGDAAALIDPFTGEGISNAMFSGIAAAESAIRCFEQDDFSAQFLKSYDEQVYRRLWKELKLSHQMQKLVKYPWLFNFVVKKANRNPSLQTMFTMMFENLDIRKELSKPSFYWDLIRK